MRKGVWFTRSAKQFCVVLTCEIFSKDLSFSFFTWKSEDGMYRLTCWMRFSNIYTFNCYSGFAGFHFFLQFLFFLYLNLHTYIHIYINATIILKYRLNWPLCHAMTDGSFWLSPGFWWLNSHAWQPVHHTMTVSFSLANDAALQVQYHLHSSVALRSPYQINEPTCLKFLVLKMCLLHVHYSLKGLSAVTLGHSFASMNDFLVSLV